jgi:2-keto-3-deoxy-L-rhamnonate aldolase RhmA/quercetin dioxygenase-like cupin family protein
MKTAATQKLKQRLAAGETALGMWVTLESPSISEMAVGLGLDWIVIDAEHGHLDWKEVTEHIRSTVRSQTVALVRLAELNIGLVKRALDVGADGVVIPWIETADQLRQAVAFAHYPPRGLRGVGGERATAWGQCFAEHVAEANENVLVVPMIESVRAGRNIKEILDVDGVQILFIGPADYSSSAGFAGQWEGPGVADQLLEIKSQIKAAGKHCGVIATSDANLLERQAQGFQLIGMGSDAGLLLRSMRTTLASAGTDRTLNTSLSPNQNMVGGGPKREIQPGVVFECLVGQHSGAKSLTAGIVTVSPTVQLLYHTHPTSESITLLDGQGLVEVEGRRYKLLPLENVLVPPGVAHSVMNASSEVDARFSIAFPTATPERELVDTQFVVTPMSDTSTGPKTPGLEQVNRVVSVDQ